MFQNQKWLPNWKFQDQSISYNKLVKTETDIKTIILS